MNITIAIFIGLSLAIVFLFFYMFARDKAIDKKFMLISAALDNINQEIYKIQKHQKDNSLKDIESIVINQIEISLEELIQSIKETQFNNKKEIEMLYDKISQLESNVKHLSLPNLEVEEKPQKDKIRELYEIGYSIEEISKEVGIPPGEIQLMLKF